VRAPSRGEQGWLWKILEVMRSKQALPTGKLFSDSLEGTTGRAQFQDCLRALVRAGYVDIVDEQFERGGETIRFKRATVTDSGRVVREPAMADVEISMAPERPRAASSTGVQRRAGRPSSGASGVGQASAGSKGSASKAERERAPRMELPDSELIRDLKRWRKDRAGDQPAYRVLTDRALCGVAELQPSDDEGLLSVAGIGQGFVRNHGEELLRFLRDRGR
jgi:superfamily II DNA helicase RecQ